MNFNENQMKAIRHKTGPAIVLAGPGSGKTTIITHRIKNLIERGVAPEKILVVTFTKAAATHMQRKFFHIMQGENWIRGSYPVSFGTFHSIYFKILKLTKNHTGEDILTEKEKYDILREITIRKKIDVQSMNDFLQNISSEISNVKGNIIDLNDYEPKSCTPEEFQCVFDEYEKALDCERKIDFDDMLLKCYQLFVNEPQMLRRWQKVFEYILIDEFQDINYVQYEIIKLLAYPENNLFIVGDDDQSVYGFRGACPELMFQFKEDYPEATEIVLDINYRSVENIVKTSESLICNNTHRFVKNIKSNSEIGENPDIRLFKTQTEELEYVTNKINQLKKTGIRCNNIAILVRNNSQIPSIQKFLQNREITVKAGKCNKKKYDSMVAQDILNYIKAAINFNDKNIQDNIELISVLNKPARYISRQIFMQDKMNFDGLEKVYEHSNEIKNNIKKLEFDLKMISKLKPSAAIMYITKGVKYENYLREYAKEKGLKASTLLEQIEEIRRDCCKYNSLEEWLYNISENNENRKDEKDIENINIMTMHSAKGLEFEAVFIVDVNQGIIPTSKAVRNKEFEEERRVFYVAITRAKSVLGIYAATESLGCKIEPSMFLNEIIKE